MPVLHIASQNENPARADCPSRCRTNVLPRWRPRRAHSRASSVGVYLARQWAKPGVTGTLTPATTISPEDSPHDQGKICSPMSRDSDRRVSDPDAKDNTPAFGPEIEPAPAGPSPGTPDVEPPPAWRGRHAGGAHTIGTAMPIFTACRVSVISTTISRWCLSASRPRSMASSNDLATRVSCPP